MPQPGRCERAAGTEKTFFTHTPAPCRERLYVSTACDTAGCLVCSVYIVLGSVSENSPTQSIFTEMEGEDNETEPEEKTSSLNIVQHITSSQPQSRKAILPWHRPVMRTKDVLFQGV